VSAARAWSRIGLVPVASIGLFLAVVEALSRSHLLPMTVARPTAVLDVALADPSILVDNLIPTLSVAAIGFAVSAVVAIGLAGVATLVKRTRSVIYNLAIVTYSVPLLALSPILVVWFGNGWTSRILIAALSGFFPILVGTMQGLTAIEPRQAELFHCLAASGWQRFRMLAVPNSLIFIFSGLKIAATSVVLGAIIAEWAGAERGLGVMMAYALYSFQVEQVWLASIVTVICAAGCYGLVLGVERIVMPWHRPATLLGDH
jgi:NitT/TauT family transport system permease protein